MRFLRSLITLRSIASLIVSIPVSLIAADNADEKALSAMPSAQHVLNTISGADNQDMHARQMAALRVLSNMVTMNRLADYLLQRRPLETKLINEYNSAMSRVADAYRLAAPNPDAAGTDLKARYMIYYSDPAFENEVVRLLLGPDAREALASRESIRKQKDKEERLYAQQDSLKNAQNEERRKDARLERIWSKLGSGLGMIGLGVFLFIVAVIMMRKTKESGLAAVGFVLILVSVVLIAAGLTEFGDLFG